MPIASSPTTSRLGHQDRDLADCPFPRLLAEIAASEATGSLLLKSGNLQKTIRFRQGVPAQVESNIASESLERFLVDRGELAESVAQKALATAASENRHVGEVLVQMRAVEPNDLFVALKRSLGKSILSIFGWERGSSSFDLGELDIDKTLLIKVKPAPLILRGVCNFTPINVIQRDFGEKLDEAHRIVKGRKHELGQLHTSAKESRIVNAIADGRTLMQLSEEVGGDHEVILRILYALCLLGLTEICARKRTIESPKPAEPEKLPEAKVAPAKKMSVSEAPTVNFAATPAPESPASEAPPEPEPEPAGPTPLTQDERNALDAAYLASRTRDYYDLFGLREDFSFGELKKAFLEKCHRFSPMSYQGRALGDQEERVEDLFLTMVRAFSLLAVPATRAAYVAEHKRSKTPAPKEQAPPARKNAYAIAVPAGVPSHVTAGLDLLNEGELPAALACLRGAYEAAPKDAYTCAFLGYLLYMVDPVSKIDQALKLLESATQLDPTLPYPFLLLGRVADFKQDRHRALRAYEDCLAIDPMENEAEEAIARLQRFVR